MSQKSTETEKSFTIEQHINVSFSLKGKNVQHIASDLLEFINEHLDADVRLDSWRMDSGEQKIYEKS